MLFMGSPHFALPTLRRLHRHINVVGVITQPDRPAGRGRRLAPPPVKELAIELGLGILQPKQLRDEDVLAQIQELNPDLIVVAAFGQILRQDVLDLPRYGALNVHASLLPRWRGAAPIQAAILNGDRETGATIMRMDAGIDTGPILSQRSLSIFAEDTAGSLEPRIAEIGAELLIETLPNYLDGTLEPVAQDDSLATHAPMLKRTDGELDLAKPAAFLSLQVRAYHPWPGTYIIWGGERLKIHEATAISTSSSTISARIIHEDFPALGTSEGILVLNQVQPAGKKIMDGETFLRGARNWVN